MAAGGEELGELRATTCPQERPGCYGARHVAGSPRITARKALLVLMRGQRSRLRFSKWVLLIKFCRRAGSPLWRKGLAPGRRPSPFSRRSDHTPRHLAAYFQLATPVLHLAANEAPRRIASFPFIQNPSGRGSGQTTPSSFSPCPYLVWRRRRTRSRPPSLNGVDSRAVLRPRQPEMRDGRVSRPNFPTRACLAHALPVGCSATPLIYSLVSWSLIARATDSWR